MSETMVDVSCLYV